MSLGDHLEELRSRTIRMLLGIGIGLVICLIFGMHIVSFLSQPILEAMKAAGFDAVDPDNIDSYLNDSGFPLTEDDAVAAMLWLADAAHERGMAIGQKNAPGLTPQLVDVLDFAVTEECLTQGWCDEVAAYVDAGKPVLAIEYIEDGASLDDLCPAATTSRLSLLVTTLDLPGTGERCPAD